MDITSKAKNHTPKPRKPKNTSKTLDEKIEDLLLYGVSSADSKGHSHTVSFRVQPAQMDVIAGIVSKCVPEGWYESKGRDNKSNVFRSVLAVGCEICLAKLAKGGIDCRDEQVWLTTMNRISKIARIEELRQNASELQVRIAELDLDRKQKRAALKELEEIKIEMSNEQLETGQTLTEHMQTVNR